MALQTWLVFVAVALLPSMSPGPAILMAVSNTLRYGPGSVVYSALGNSCGHIVLGFAVAFGLAAIMETSAWVFTAVKLLGAGYLIYLGLKLWLTGNALKVDVTATAPAKSRKALFAEAFLLSVTNPKGLLLIAVLLPPFVDHAQPVIPQVAILAVTWAAMCFLNHMLLAYAGARVRKLLLSPERVKTVQRALGSLFLAFGASLAFASR
jgi:threonine/homoserine/homoserine lactone efflux protein